MHNNQQHNQNVLIIACNSQPWPWGTITLIHIKCILIAHIYKRFSAISTVCWMLALQWAAVLLLHLANPNVQLLEAFLHLSDISFRHIAKPFNSWPNQRKNVYAQWSDWLLTFAWFYLLLFFFLFEKMEIKLLIVYPGSDLHYSRWKNRGTWFSDIKSWRC